MAFPPFHWLLYFNDSDIMNDDAWDDLFVQPHQSFVEDGMREGREAWRREAFQQGHKLGKTTAISHGVEIGFVRGVAKALAASNLDQVKLDLKTKLDDLFQALEEYPAPEEVFRGEQQQPDSTERLKDNEQQIQPRNVESILQRIHSKFKLLTVNMGFPYFSLNYVMDQANVKDSGELNSEW